MRPAMHRWTPWDWRSRTTTRLADGEAPGRAIWRSTRRGQLPNGIEFYGPQGLRTLLLERREQFSGTVTEKLLAYAIGRGPEHYDRATVRGITRGSSFRRLPLVVYYCGYRAKHAISNAEVGVMIITKKAIPRRTMLRGLGASLALPLLDGMVPAFTALRDTAANPVRRLGIVYVPNGMMMDHWTPTTEGSGFDFPTILKPLEPFRKHVQLLSGMHGVDAEGPHARASTRFLTGVASLRDDGSNLRAGISMDQIAGRVLGRETQLATLELAIDGRDFAGSCDDGFSCAYTNTISWANETTPLPMENNPRRYSSGSSAIGQHRPCGPEGTTGEGRELARFRHGAGALPFTPTRLGRPSPSWTSTSRPSATSNGESRWPRPRATSRFR